MRSKNRHTIFRLIFLVFIAFFNCLFLSAQVKVTTVVDNNQILIGQQFKLTVSAAFMPDEYDITWLKIPDTFYHFEVIERSEIDSIYAEDKLVGFEQHFTMTSFDSGKWPLPSFPIEFLNKKEKTSDDAFTDSIPIMVSYSFSDTTQQLRDIKPIREADDATTFWYWIIGGALLLLLAGLAIWFFRYRKSNSSTSAEVSSISAFDIAKQQLTQLRKMSLSTPEEIKTYHSGVTDVFKKYASAVFKVNYANKTTGELLILLKQAEVDAMSISALAAVLRSNDAVKFAKYLPDNNESRNALVEIEKIIQYLANNNHTQPSS